MQQTIARTTRPRLVIAGRLGPLRGDVRAPAFQAFLLLWVAFTVAPILFGIDKFFNWMTFWPSRISTVAGMTTARNRPQAGGVGLVRDFAPESGPAGSGVSVRGEHLRNDAAEAYVTRRSPRGSPRPGADSHRVGPPPV